MPSASTIATSLEGNHILDIVDSCKYCKTHNGCYVSDPSQPDSFSSSNNGSISLRISSNPIHHTCTTPVTELPGHRGSERIRFLNQGCCNQRVDNNKPQPQMTGRGRSTQRRGRLVQLSGVPIVSECLNQASYPSAHNKTKFSCGSNYLPPPHPYANGSTKQQTFCDPHSNNHPYAGPYLQKQFSNNSNRRENAENDSPSILLSTATVEDDSSNNERPSRWSRHRGRARKRSPSARQRASASVIRHQDCSPPPIQRDRPPSPPPAEETRMGSPALVFSYNGRSEMDKKECPICQPRYSQSPEKLGVRPILSQKLSMDSSSLFVHEMTRDPYLNCEHQIAGCVGVVQNKVPKESRHERRRRAKSEYRPKNNARRRQSSPDININHRTQHENLMTMDSRLLVNEEHQHQKGNMKYQRNLRQNHDQHYCRSAHKIIEKDIQNISKHDNHQFPSLMHIKHPQIDLNGNEDKCKDTSMNDYEEPKQKTCKETLRKKFSVNGRSISKASKSRRRGRKGQEQYQEDDLKSPGLIIHKDNNIKITDVSLHNNIKKVSANISRSKSRSRFGEIFSTGLQTIWPAKAGIWLPQ